MYEPMPDGHDVSLDVDEMESRVDQKWQGVLKLLPRKTAGSLEVITNKLHRIDPR